MKKYNVFLLLKVLIISNLISSCTSKNAENKADYAISGKASTVQADSAFAMQRNEIGAENDATKGRKFIRTAETKFRVKDVRKSTQIIEDLTAKNGGFIINMNLQTNQNSTNSTQISADSLLEITSFVIENDITIRVPNQRLDSLLRNMNDLIEFLDFRNIKADEVTLSLLSNSLKVKRLDEFTNRNKGNIDKRKGNILDASDAENNVLDRQNQADNYRIQQQNLQDQINFSTVNLHIYQRQISKKEIIENEKSMEAYKPNLLFRIWDSAKTGWIILEEIIIFLFKFWTIFILVFLSYFFIKKFRK